MRDILLIAILLLSTSTSFADIYKNELKVGDVILLPMKCWVCTLIEEETSSEYSHSGVILSASSNEIWIGQSLGKVHSVKLADFLRMKDPLRPLLIVRPKELTVREISNTQSLKVYNNEFKDLPFDHDYLWDNFDGKKEELYCSEFITKFLNRFLINKIAPESMSYAIHYQYWQNYFHNSPPEGLPGISPAYYERSSNFTHLGELMR